jgi:hypothetical protein
MFFQFVRKAGTEKRLDQHVGVRDVNRLIIEGGATPLNGREPLLPERIIDYSTTKLTLLLQRYADRKEGKSVGIVGGPIKGIDDLARPTLPFVPLTLLGKDGVVREATVQKCDNGSLRPAVDFGDDIDPPLVIDLRTAAESFHEDPTRLFCRFPGGC